MVLCWRSLCLRWVDGFCNISLYQVRETVRQVVQAAMEAAEAPVKPMKIWPAVHTAVTALGPAALKFLPDRKVFGKTVERMRNKQVRKYAEELL